MRAHKIHVNLFPVPGEPPKPEETLSERPHSLHPKPTLPHIQLGPSPLQVLEQAAGPGK